MDCFLNLEIEVIVNYLLEKRMRKEEVTKILKNFDEKSLIFLLVNSSKLINYKEYNKLAKIVYNIILDNRNKIINKFNFTEDEYVTIEYFYRELVNGLMYSSEILNYAKCIQRIHYSALMVIAKYKGDENLYQILCDTDRKLNEELLCFFMEDVNTYIKKNRFNEYVDEKIETKIETELEFTKEELEFIEEELGFTKEDLESIEEDIKQTTAKALNSEDKSYHYPRYMHDNFEVKPLDNYYDLIDCVNLLNIINKSFENPDLLYLDMLNKIIMAHMSDELNLSLNLEMSYLLSLKDNIIYNKTKNKIYKRIKDKK